MLSIPVETQIRAHILVEAGRSHSTPVRQLGQFPTTLSRVVPLMYPRHAGWTNKLYTPANINMARGTCERRRFLDVTLKFSLVSVSLEQGQEPALF